jgi:hypothetical protein
VRACPEIPLPFNTISIDFDYESQYSKPKIRHFGINKIKVIRSIKMVVFVAKKNNSYSKNLSGITLLEIELKPLKKT